MLCCNSGLNKMCSLQDSPQLEASTEPQCENSDTAYSDEVQTLFVLYFCHVSVRGNACLDGSVVVLILGFLIDRHIWV